MHNFIICPVCKQKFKSITSHHYKKHGYTSAKEFKIAFGLDSLNSPSKTLKHSKFMKKNNPMLGRHHSTKALNLMRVNRTGKGIGKAGKYIRTAKIRNKISKAISEICIKGNNFIGYQVESKKSWTGSLWVRSSWEHRVVRILDAHPQVHKVETEPFYIPYRFDGFVHRYIPDFLISCHDQLQILIEVKPEEYLIGDTYWARRNRTKIRMLEAFTLKKPLMIGQLISTKQEIRDMEKRFLGKYYE